MTEELLREYDLFHTTLIYGGVIKFNINYLNNKKVYISLVGLINNVETNSRYDFDNDEEFNSFVLPKIIERFLSKNYGIKSRRIMGNDENGTLIVDRNDGKDTLVIRNCSKEVMNVVDKFISALNSLNDVNYYHSNKIIIDENSNEVYENYIKYNLLFDYAYYRNNYLKSNSSLASDIEKSIKDEDDDSTNKLLVLNIARYAYMFEGNQKENLWDEIKETYKDKEAVKKICDAFKDIENQEDPIYKDALVLAEFEKNNDQFLHTSDHILELAEEAVREGVNFFDDSYVEFFKKKQAYYSSVLDTEHEIICLDYLDSHSLGENLSSVELKNKLSTPVDKPSSFIDDFKAIHAKKVAFADILNDPIEEEEDVHYKLDDDSIYEGAEEQARMLHEIIQERDLIKKDAEEFAKQIIQKEREHKEIVDASLEQAKKIIELENENNELRKLAEENAKVLFDRDSRMREEQRLREIIDNSPIKAQDIDKINNLLNAISSCKELDFAINHPTVMQELLFLEEKIITYITTHKNVISEGDVILPIEKEEMLESKPVIELLSMIRNAYVQSHQFEKSGRHTVMYFTPVDDDTYRLSLYSVKDDEDDMLMDAFFEDYQLTESVIEQICDIFKNDAVIVASKIDNVPIDKADYLVIDNMNNAFKFMGCKRDFIEVIKKYL